MAKISLFIWTSDKSIHSIHSLLSSTLFYQDNLSFNFSHDQKHSHYWSSVIRVCLRSIRSLPLLDELLSKWFGIKQWQWCSFIAIFSRYQYFDHQNSFVKKRNNLWKSVTKSQDGGLWLAFHWFRKWFHYYFDNMISNVNMHFR